MSANRLTELPAKLLPSLKIPINFPTNLTYSVSTYSILNPVKNHYLALNLSSEKLDTGFNPVENLDSSGFIHDFVAIIKP